MSFEKINEKGESNLTINKIILLVLGILVVVLVAWVILNPYVLDWAKNLPGYSYNETDRVIENLTQDKLVEMGCENAVGRVLSSGGGFFSKSINFIYIGGVKTNLHLSDSNGDKEIMLRYLGNDIKVGDMTDNKVKIFEIFLKESLDYIKYKGDGGGEGLPSLDLLKILHDSMLFPYGGYFCKNKEQIDSVKQEKQCVETCELYNGNCRDSKMGDEVSLGTLDCGNNQCYVKIVYEKLKDDDLRVVFFYPEGTSVSIIKENALNIIQGKNILFFYEASYDGFTKPHCYIIRTDKEVLFKGYGIMDNRGVASISASEQKILEFVAWAPWDNKKVYKRIKLNTEVNKDFEGYKWVNDKDFKNAITQAKIGTEFLVSTKGISLDYKTTFSGTFPVMIDVFSAYKTGENNIAIWGYYRQPDKASAVKEWHQLDCNGWYGASNIGMNDVKESLTETILKNNCELK